MMERDYCMMRDCTRKLALWHTRTFKPILTHDDLEPILATKGFLSSSSSSSSSSAGDFKWVEYVYSSAAATTAKFDVVSPPKARLPDSRIDGLHIYTYRAFIDAVNFYLDTDDISTLFHIRGMPLHRISDRYTKWVSMEEDGSILVYREGTLDQTTDGLYGSSNKQSSHGHDDRHMVIRDRGKKMPESCIVSLKDIVATETESGSSESVGALPTKEWCLRSKDFRI